MTDSSPIPERYKRNMNALSAVEIRMLNSSHVAVVGCGGLGGYVIETLGRIGIGKLTCIDADVFDDSNLNRQLLCTQDNIGQSKAQAARERLAHVNSEVTVRDIQTTLNEQNAQDLLREVDCVVDCLDSTEVRFWMAHACQNLEIPVVHGSVAGWFGQVATVFPGDPSFVEIYSADERESLHHTLGVLPFSPACVAQFQCAEVVKICLGRNSTLRNRMLMIDMLDGSVEEIEIG